MFEMDVPYDRRRLRVRLPERNVAGVLVGRQGNYEPDAEQEELIERALDDPYGTPRLDELCRGKRDIVIISSDHTRPVPSRVTMPILLRRVHA